MLRGWLIYSEEDSKKNEWLINEYIKEGKTLDITIELLIADDIGFGIKNDTWFLQYNDQELILQL